MFSYQLPRIKPPKNLQLYLRRSISQSKLPNNLTKNGHSNGRPEPTPSQLLRFSLSGTTQQPQVTLHESELDELLQSFIVAPWALKPPLSPWSIFGRRAIPSTHQQDQSTLKNATCLRDLYLYVEREINTNIDGEFLLKHCNLLSQALHRCHQHHPSKEILSFLNALVTRLHKLGTPISKDISFLGMHFACLSFSFLALKGHIDDYKRITNERLEPADSELLITSLLSTLRLTRFEDPGYANNQMVYLLTGEGQSSHNIQYTLSDVLCDLSGKEDSAGVIGKYACLLGMLQAEQSLESVWNTLKQHLIPGCNQRLIAASYACVTAFIDTGRLKEATLCLTEISERANNTLPEISTESRLIHLLIDHHLSDKLFELAGKEECMTLLDSQLRTIEMRLGLEWHNAQSCHSMIDDSLHPIGSQPFLTVDGDHVGLHTTQRFVEEIRALGCSNSSSDLGRIAELLDEHEGEDIPLCTQHLGSWDNQFAWMPQRSPIEFSHCLSAPGHNTRISWDPASLGLVCARLDCQGKPMADEHTLHLLQLGYLCMRPASDIEQREWISSGHIVAWDRVNGGFVAIFVGKGHGVISSGYLPSSLPSPSRVGALSRIIISRHSYRFKQSIEASLVLQRAQGLYHLDVDRSRGLKP